VVPDLPGAGPRDRPPLRRLRFGLQKRPIYTAALKTALDDARNGEFEVIVV
jgi:hypothetical protein